MPHDFFEFFTGSSLPPKESQKNAASAQREFKVTIYTQPLASPAQDFFHSLLIVSCSSLLLHIRVKCMHFFSRGHCVQFCPKKTLQVLFSLRWREHIRISSLSTTGSKTLETPLTFTCSLTLQPNTQHPACFMALIGGVPIKKNSSMKN